MDHKKIIFGSVVLLIVVFMTQSTTFNKLIDTEIGKITMVGLVLLASYIHQLLGVIVVFFIILMINKTDILEGFDNKETDIPKDISEKKVTNSDHHGVESTIQKGKSSNTIPTIDNNSNIVVSPSEPKQETFSVF
jgi:hypothetical protein